MKKKVELPSNKTLDRFLRNQNVVQAIFHSSYPLGSLAQLNLNSNTVRTKQRKMSSYFTILLHASARYFCLSITRNILHSEKRDKSSANPKKKAFFMTQFMYLTSFECSILDQTFRIFHPFTNRIHQRIKHFPLLVEFFKVSQPRDHLLRNLVNLLVHIPKKSLHFHRAGFRECIHESVSSLM